MQSHEQTESTSQTAVSAVSDSWRALVSAAMPVIQLHHIKWFLMHQQFYLSHHKLDSGVIQIKFTSQVIHQTGTDAEVGVK